MSEVIHKDGIFSIFHDLDFQFQFHHFGPNFFIQELFVTFRLV